MTERNGFFLRQMMCKLGFDEVFCNWVMECVMTVTYSVMLNGEASRFITPSRGLGQGDPLSPVLFLICSEGFSSLIRREERDGRLRGLQVSANAEPLSHVFFEDNSVFFCQATESETVCVNNLLPRYAEGSGQSINLDKSSVHFSSNCSDNFKSQLAAVMRIGH